MKRYVKLVFIAFALNFILAGCTQWPTEKQSISDLRPGISFKSQSPELLNARVTLDGLDMGQAKDYQEGIALMRVLPGPHMLIVSLNGRKILEEKIYAGDGVNQTFLIH